MEKNLCLEHKVVLKVAQANDLPVLFSLVDDYDGDVQVNKTRIKNAIREIVYVQGAVIAEVDRQVIGAVVGYALPCLYNDDVIFSVMFFYVRKQYRKFTKDIVRELELVLLPTKVNLIAYGFIVNQDYLKLQRYMKILGYKEIGTHLAKRI